MPQPIRLKDHEKDARLVRRRVVVGGGCGADGVNHPACISCTFLASCTGVGGRIAAATLPMQSGPGPAAVARWLARCRSQPSSSAGFRPRKRGPAVDLRHPASIGLPRVAEGIPRAERSARWTRKN